MATSKISYLGGLRTSAEHLASGEKITTDAPIDNNGKGEAFSPTDLAATSLGSCAMTIMGIVAEREAIQLEGSTVEVTKIMSTDSPRRIVKIEVHFTLHTPEPLTEVQQKKLENAAHTCPVAHSLHPAIEQVFQFTWVTSAS